MSTQERSGTGLVFFAAVMLIIIGIFDIFDGLAFIIKPHFYVQTPNYYVHFNASSWGWIDLILGVIVMLAGLALLRGATWARLVAIAVAGLSAVANFLSIPIYPFWAILIIVIDVTIIYAVAAHGGQLRER